MWLETLASSVWLGLAVGSAVIMIGPYRLARWLHLDLADEDQPYEERARWARDLLLVGVVLLGLWLVLVVGPTPSTSGT